MHWKGEFCHPMIMKLQNFGDAFAETWCALHSILCLNFMRRTSNLRLLVSSHHLKLQKPGGQSAGFILCKRAIARSIGWKWCRWSAESIWESVSRSNKTVTLSQKLFSKSPFIFSYQKFMWGGKKYKWTSLNLKYVSAQFPHLFEEQISATFAKGMFKNRAIIMFVKLFL